MKCCFSTLFLSFYQVGSDEAGRWARIAAVLRGETRGPEAWSCADGEVVARWSRVFGVANENEGVTGEDRFLEQDMLRAREMVERRHGVVQADAEAKTVDMAPRKELETSLEELDGPEHMDISDEEIDDGLYLVEEPMAAVEVDDWEKRIIWGDAPPAKNKPRVVAFDQGEVDTGRWLDDVRKKGRNMCFVVVLMA